MLLDSYAHSGDGTDTAGPICLLCRTIYDGRRLCVYIRTTLLRQTTQREKPLATHLSSPLRLNSYASILAYTNTIHLRANLGGSEKEM